MNSKNESYRKGLSRVEKSSKLYVLCVHGVVISSLEDLSVIHSLIIFYIFDSAVLVQDLNTLHFLLVRIWLTHTVC